MNISQHTIDIQFYYSNFSDLINWLYEVIKNEKVKPGELNIIFTSDLYLLTLNNQYLNHDYFTDVLSFDYSTDNVISGDIFISIDRVKENSLTYNIDFYTELDRVIVHGLLHLIGYNDSELNERKIMQQKEIYYLQIR